MLLKYGLNEYIEVHVRREKMFAFRAVCHYVAKRVTY